MQLTGNALSAIFFFFSKHKLKYALLLFTSLIVGAFEAICALAIYPVISTLNISVAKNENVFFDKFLTGN